MFGAFNYSNTYNNCIYLNFSLTIFYRYQILLCPLKRESSFKNEQLRVSISSRVNMTDKNIQSTLHMVSILYNEHLHIVNIFDETLQWKLIGIVSLYSEPLYIVNKILLQIVFTIWRVDCSSLMTTERRLLQFQF